jgi:carboxyl-terminal processing protease
VILSVAKFYSPSGKAIQDTGVTPSIMITDADVTPEAEEDNQPDVAPKKEGDAPMKRAIEVLTTGKTDQAAAGKAKD